MNKFQLKQLIRETINEMQVNQPRNFDPTKPGSDEKLLSFIKQNKIKILQHLSENNDLAIELGIEDGNLDAITLIEDNLFLKYPESISTEEYPLGLTKNVAVQRYPGGAVYELSAVECLSLIITNFSESHDGIKLIPLKIPGVRDVFYTFYRC
jgi:hypothetical protein